jgi:carboxymethylenebutenolidase
VPDIKASVVFYGGGALQARGGPGPTPLERTNEIKCPVLGLFGQEDQNPSPADVAKIEAELKKHGKTYEFHTYPGAGHGFHCDVRASYRREAAVDGWGKALGWFNKHLKG